MVPKKKITTNKKVTRNVCAEFLHESEEQYRQLVELSQDAIVIIDNKGIFKMVNPAACSLFGYSSEEEMIGLPVLNTYRPEDRQDYAKRLKQIKLGESPRFERKAVKKDGQLIDVEVATTPIDHEKYQAIIRDITDRKKAENIVKENEFWMKESQRVAQIGSYLLDTATGLWTSSEELDKIFGIGEKYNHSVEGWVKIIHPEHQKMMAQYFQNDVLTKKKPFNKEYKIIRQNDKQTRWVRGLGELVLDERKNPIKMIGTIQDITEHKTTEISLRESEEKYSVLVEKSNDGVIVMQDEIVKYVNAAASQITGYDRDAVIGTPFMKYVSPKYKKIVLERYAKRLKGAKVPDRYEIAILSKGGRETPIEINASQIEYEGGPAVMAIVRDISDRKRYEENLKTLSAAIEQSANGIAIATLDGDITFANEAWRKMHGYKTTQELIGKNLSIFHTKEQFKNDVTPFIKKVTSLGTHSGEVGHVTKSGVTFPTHMTVTLLKDEDAKPYAIVGVAEDITEIKKMEEELRDNEARLHAIIENEPECVKLLDSNGNLLKMNAAGLAMIDAKFEQVKGQKVVNLVAEEDRAAFDEMIKAVFLGETRHLVFDMIGLKGRRLTLETTSAPLRGPGGKVESLLGVTRNITEKIQAEKALKESEERLRITLEETQIGAWDWDVKNDIWYASPTYYTMLGYKPETGKADRGVWMERVHPDDRNIASEKIKKVLDGSNSKYQYEVRMKDADGKYRWISVLGRTIEQDSNGKPIRMIGVRTDITDRKKTEEEFHRIFDESPIGIATLGLDLKFIKVNKSFCDLVGYNEEELLLLGIKDITHPDHIASDLGNIKKLMAGNALSYKTEKRYVRKNGDVVWGLTTMRVVKEDGQPSYLLKTVENITYQKIADEQLIKKVEEINSFFDITPDLLCISDSSGKFLRLNRSWESMLGYSVKDLLGKNMIDFVHPEDIEKTRKMLNVATQEPLVDFANRYLSKDGSYRKLEWRSRPVGGTIYSTARDITGRKEQACEQPHNNK